MDAGIEILYPKVRINTGDYHILLQTVGKPSISNNIRFGAGPHDVRQLVFFHNSIRTRVYANPRRLLCQGLVICMLIYSAVFSEYTKTSEMSIK